MGRALIVGAGIGGLAAALALRQTGWDVRVYERANSPRELGFALLLAPNAMAALRRLGLAEVTIEGGFIAHRGEIRRQDGTTLRAFDVADVGGRLGEPTVCILRPILHSALLDAVSAGAVELGHAVTGFGCVDGGVEILLDDGRRVAGDILIGADGVASAVRSCLGGATRGHPPTARVESKRTEVNDDALADGLDAVCPPDPVGSARNPGASPGG
jgi:2-polyprenyl-6-methoxyphenol hydroxylase-like FAD-dependent oxidoreductase